MNNPCSTLAMLHELSSTASPREVWWLYGARNRNEHPFAKESRGLMRALARGRSHIVYSQPEPQDQLGLDYDSPGRLNVLLLDQLGVSRNADFYLCGPPSFLRGFTADLGVWSTDSILIHAEVFGPEESLTPGIALLLGLLRIFRRGLLVSALRFRLREAGSRSRGMHASKAYWNSPRPATSPHVGRVAPVSATPANAR
jgi:hypothetical protein